MQLCVITLSWALKLEINYLNGLSTRRWSLHLSDHLSMMSKVEPDDLQLILGTVSSLDPPKCKRVTSSGFVYARKTIFMINIFKTNMAQRPRNILAINYFS